MAAMQTTMINASITAYSTAVGPSSAFRNFTRAFVNLRMTLSVPFLQNRRCVRNRPSIAQLEVVLTLLPTYWKVLEALEPRALMAAMQTTMINASITAY